ncbi:PhnA domain-containing protein [Membranihabitans marinus]|uniref:PhnA domain-containing protein n=1 Tax=Membranihabitans marinus TaxID=1227546 RepID=UPI001F15CB40|nr:alkylphosphonate utilization protein [Membranihabitans marinus]
MSLEQDLKTRSQGKCELCTASEELYIYSVPPAEDEDIDNTVYVCGTCKEQIEDETKVDANHWRCLNDTMWSTVPAVQVLAWRMLQQLRGEGWPLDLLDMLYLDEETLNWAQALGGAEDGEEIKHVDSNGVVLEAGDTVTLIKDLAVKGSSLVAKRGTAVRRISLVHDNAEHIEGKVDGQTIVILTKFVKKSK